MREEGLLNPRRRLFQVDNLSGAASTLPATPSASAYSTATASTAWSTNLSSLTRKVEHGALPCWMGLIQILFHFITNNYDHMVCLILIFGIYECQHFCPRRKRKAQEMEVMEALPVWVEMSKARNEAYSKCFIAVASMIAKFKASKPKTRAMEGKPKFLDSSASSTLKNCLQRLEAMEGVDGRTYAKALQMFRDDEWKEMFIAMPDKRRRQWLASLE